MDSENKGNNVPAFPCPSTRDEVNGEIWNPWPDGWGGFSQRQLAAILLRVPDSDLPWLNEMITKARKLDTVTAVVGGVNSHPKNNNMSFAEARRIADDLLAEEGGDEDE